MDIDNKKPVVMLHYIMPNQLGGPNIVMKRIINSELNKNYKFEMLVQDKLAGGKINIGLILYLMKKIKNVNPDILHISGLQSAGFHCICAAKLAGCKRIVVTIHGFSGDDIKLSPFKRWVFNNIIEPFTLRCADVVLGNSEYTITREMVKKYAKNCEDYVYTLPPEPYVNFSEDPLIRDELKLSKDDLLVVMVGRVVLDKGFNVLAQTIKQLTDLENVKFLIVGNGNYFQTFKKIVANEIADGRVYLLGARNDVQRILSGCDIFVLPTLHETLSNVTLEAAVEGLAIVVSNTGGLREIIEQDVDGMLVPPGDISALTQAVRYLAGHPEVRSRLGENAKKKIQTKFSRECIIKKLDEVYQHLLQK